MSSLRATVRWARVNPLVACACAALEVIDATADTGQAARHTLRLLAPAITLLTDQIDDLDTRLTTCPDQTRSGPTGQQWGDLMPVPPAAGRAPDLPTFLWSPPSTTGRRPDRLWPTRGPGCSRRVHGEHERQRVPPGPEQGTEHLHLTVVVLGLPLTAEVPRHRA
jgi:hypothetical protein